MLKEFIDFVDSVLPSVDPEAKNIAKEAIEQFNKTDGEISYVTDKPLPQLSQGDVISNIPFIYIDDNGEYKNYSADGLILSTSCHIDQKEYYNIVPLLSLDSIDNESTMFELKANRIYEYMYFPNSILEYKYVDFSKVNTYNRDLINKGLKIKKFERICSLSQIGYYFLIIKLTVFLMRKEDRDTMSSRDEGVSFNFDKTK